MTSPAHATVRPRIPSDIKLELYAPQHGLLPRITEIVKSQEPAEGDVAAWLTNLQDFLAGGEAMIVNARIGRTLVGFVVLDSANRAAPFSWIDARYRNRGLGERFYSFACINLAAPTPEFRFPKDHLEEFDGVLKAAGAQPTLRDSVYVVHERVADEAEAA